MRAATEIQEPAPIALAGLTAASGDRAAVARLALGALLWLAATEKDLSPGGRFWFDRQPRRTHVGSWTRETPEERAKFWQQMCAWIGCSPEAFSGPQTNPG